MTLVPATAPSDTPEAAPAPPPRRPRVWSVFLVLVALLGVITVATVVLLGLIAGIVVARSGAAPEPEAMTALVKGLLERPWVLGVMTVMTALINGGVALGAAAASPVPVRARLRLGLPRGLPPLHWVLGCAGVVGLSVALGSVTRMLGLWPSSGPLYVIANAARAADTGELVLLLLGIALGTGVAEEWVFRGYAQTRLVERWGRWPGVLAAAVLFGLFHMSPAQSLLSLALGVAMGWLAERSGSVWPAAAAHVANNTVALLLPRALAGAQRSAALDATLLCAGAAAAGLALWALRAPMERPAPAEGGVAPVVLPGA